MQWKQKCCAVYAPFSPILMLLGKLKLEPRQIPSKLVQMIVKLRCIFPFALARRKIVGIQAYVCPCACEVKFLSPPPADAPTVAAASPAASTLTKRGFRRWRRHLSLSSVPSLYWCSPVLGCCCCRRRVISAWAALQKGKKKKEKARLQTLLRLPPLCFKKKNSSFFKMIFFFSFLR